MATINSPRSRYANEIQFLIPKVVDAINDFKVATQITYNERDQTLRARMKELSSKIEAYKKEGGNVASLQNRLCPELGDQGAKFFKSYTDQLKSCL